MTVLPATNDTGTGLIGSLAGLSVFLVLLLFAVQITLDLYGRSTIAALGFDAARQAAVGGTPPLAGASPDSAPAKARAEQRLRRSLGQAAAGLRADWSASDSDYIRLHLVLTLPSVGGRARLDRMTGLDRFDRLFVVRIERFHG